MITIRRSRPGPGRRTRRDGGTAAVPGRAALPTAVRAWPRRGQRGDLAARGDVQQHEDRCQDDRADAAPATGERLGHLPAEGVDTAVAAVRAVRRPDRVHEHGAHDRAEGRRRRRRAPADAAADDLPAGRWCAAAAPAARNPAAGAGIAAGIRGVYGCWPYGCWYAGRAAGRAAGIAGEAAGVRLLPGTVAGRWEGAAGAGSRDGPSAAGGAVSADVRRPRGRRIMSEDLIPPGFVPEGGLHGFTRRGLAAGVRPCPRVP